MNIKRYEVEYLKRALDLMEENVTNPSEQEKLVLQDLKDMEPNARAYKLGYLMSAIRSFCNLALLKDDSMKQKKKARHVTKSFYGYEAN